MRASIVLRTYNEEKYLTELLDSIRCQESSFKEIEVVLVDSGSTDKTLEIATRFNCRIVQIKKEEFTFGRSLNVGCEAALGEVLVFISGHCVPTHARWLENLTAPIRDGVATYSYGRQLGRDTTKFSESQVFAKYFPEHSVVPQDGFFCNNANAALLRDAWSRHGFDETLTGLEDMCLAKRLCLLGLKVGYVAEAPVYHIHDETWRQVRIRFEREALALRNIMPEVHVRWNDALRYLTSGILNDLAVALADRTLRKCFAEIVMFRCMQYWGTYRGNVEHRRVSARRREEYFYPTKSRGNRKDDQRASGVTTDESSQRTSAT